MNTYPVLQSGFVGLTQKGLRRPDITEPSLRQSVIYKAYRLPLTKYYYSEDVTDLYFQWCRQPDVLKDFDFREKLISTAMKVFGNASFYKWLEMQGEKPTVGSLHKAFILETLEYLLNGTPRSIQISQWARLLEANDESSSVRVDIEKFFGGQTLGCVQSKTVPVSLHSVIKSWVSLEYGFEDLLISLFVIFGDRIERVDISNGPN